MSLMCAAQTSSVRQHAAATLVSVVRLPSLHFTVIKRNLLTEFARGLSCQSQIVCLYVLKILAEVGSGPCKADMNAVIVQHDSVDDVSPLCSLLIDGHQGRNQMSDGLIKLLQLSGHESDNADYAMIPRLSALILSNMSSHPALASMMISLGVFQPMLNMLSKMRRTIGYKKSAPDSQFYARILLTIANIAANPKHHDVLCPFPAWPEQDGVDSSSSVEPPLLLALLPFLEEDSIPMSRAQQFALARRYARKACRHD